MMNLKFYWHELGLTNMYFGSTVGSGLWSHLIAFWGSLYEHQLLLMRACIKGSGNILAFGNNDATPANYILGANRIGMAVSNGQSPYQIT